MKSKKIKLAFVGAGFIGQLCHIKNYYTNKNCEIIAIAEIKKKLCDLVASKYSIPNRFYSHEELIKSGLIYDAAIIITKRESTPAIAYDFLKKGISVFTEKPMALNSKDAQMLVKITKKNKLIFKVGYNKIYDEGVQYAKKQFDILINNKKFGDIIYIRAHRFSGTGYANQSGNIKTNEVDKKIKSWDRCPNWLNKKKYSKYKSYLNVNSHLINLLLFFLKVNPKVEYSDVDNAKSELVILNFNKIKTVIETKAYKDHSWDEEIVFYFENGYVKINTPPQQLENISAKITIYNRLDRSINIVCKENWSWSFKKQSDEFIKDLKSKRMIINSCENSVNDIKVIENIWKNRNI